MISTSPTKIKKPKTIVISEKVKNMDNIELATTLKHTSYNFCMVDMKHDDNDRTINTADKMLELMLEALDRIFIHNHLYNISQFKIYETVERIFSKQPIYDINKALSGLKRVSYWDGINPLDEKYIQWFGSRVKHAVFVLCNNLEHIEIHENGYSTVTN
jgi:hypothetical protein